MPATTEADSDRTALDLMLRGFQLSRMLRLAADLGIADRILPDGHVSVDALATSCKVQSTQLVRVLRALAAFEVFSVSTEGTVAHTPRSRLLRTDAPGSLHHAARFWTSPGSWKAWGEIDAALTGGVPHEAAWGMSRFAYLRTQPDEARAYNAMMAAFPDDRHAAIAAAYDFSGARLVCDVGGGDGATLRHILASLPELRGQVFDQKGVVRAIPADRLMNGRIAIADGISSTKCRAARTSTCWSAFSTIGATRTACAFCAPPAWPWDRTHSC
jgi:O-methyltransferase domain